MRKLRLRLDTLKVETFDPRAAPAGGAGTVRAHDSESPPATDPYQHTCDVMSCNGTCWLTPNICGTCGTETGIDPTCDGCG
jgi:hypothetical protein